MGLIFGDTFDKKDLQATSRSDFRNHHAQRPSMVKKRSNDSSALTYDDGGGSGSSGGSLPPLPKNVVNPQLKGEMEQVRHDSRHRKGLGGSRAESQVDCSIIGAPFNSLSEYNATCKKVRNSAAPQPHQGRSSFNAPCNPITGLPSKYKPPGFEHVAGGGPRISVDSIAKGEQRGRIF